jgi:hypothetical protein
MRSTHGSSKVPGNHGHGYSLGRSGYPLEPMPPSPFGTLHACNVHGTSCATSHPRNIKGERGEWGMVRTIRILLLVALHTSAAGADRATAVAALADGLARAHGVERSREELPS